jgi:predicted O-linked N-acetylglucosamine transferase (SPINDLY family)
LLEALPAEEFEVVCYSDTAKPDAMTARIRARAALWRETIGFPEEALAAQIRADRVDILFDLAGHTADNRLPVFARKPAPIQITWLDYVGTTGLAAMDYLLADARQVPPGAETFYREKILRMPGDYICYDPPADAPEPGPLPALSRGGVTFGNFSALTKVTSEVLAVWAEILRQVPGSRLILKNRVALEPDTQTRLRALLPGIAPERVEFRGWSPPAEAMAMYGEVDLALDTFPYNGGLTVCEALWMGVPVITCPGETFASRHGFAHLTAAGFPETIAQDTKDYVEKAVAWATYLPRLAAARAELRDRVTASGLCDGPRFAADFAQLIRQVWRDAIT